MPLSRGEATEQLRKALVDHAEAYGQSEPNWLLNEAAIVCAWIDPDYEDGVWYSTASLRQGNLPNYILGGLFMEGVATVYRRHNCDYD